MSEDFAGQITTAHRIRNILGGSAGNLVEWYDWYIYAAFGLYFAPIFFPEGDRTFAWGAKGLFLALPPGHVPQSDHH